MTMTITEKAQRTVRLLIGSKNRVIFSAMRAYGFNRAEQEEGWALLKAVGDARGEMEQAPPADTKTLHEIDVWENRWFPIARAALNRRYPAVAARFFQNLSQMSGPEVVISVQLFLDRFDALADDAKYGPEGAKAKELFNARGLTAAVVDEARALMLSLRVGEQPLTPSAIEEAKANAGKAEDALWAWYLEWSQVARTAVKSRVLLRQLGFLSSQGAGADDASEDGATTDGAAAPAATAVTN